MWQEPHPHPQLDQPSNPSMVKNSKSLPRSLSTRFCLLTSIQKILLALAVLFSCWLLLGYAEALFFGHKSVKPVIKRGFMPQENVTDTCDCEQQLMKELMRGPLLSSDKRLIKFFKQHYLVPPSVEPYNLTDESEGEPDDDLSDIVLELLNQKREGFFVESRVKLVDEDTNKFISNTLHLEKEYGWEGVIFEPDTDVYKRLQSKNRKAYLIPGAISPSTYPVEFFPEADKTNESEIEQIRRDRKKFSALIVQGIPLATVFKAFKVDTIDYFSLAVPGRELEVLGTIPWERIKIQVLTIEHVRDQTIFNMIGNMMQQKGYFFISSVVEEKHEASIYAHPSLFE